MFLPFLFALLPLALAGNPIDDQASLEGWWTSAAKMWLGDTAYKVKGLQFSDGVCDARFNDGLLIPVWSGKKPVSHRIVGLVYIGDGTLQVRFPERADAWAFANHRVLQGGASVDALRPVAREGQPWETKFDRTLILSGDPKVERMLLDLEPVGGGVGYVATPENGVDEVYVVSEKQGTLKVKAVATNLLPDRRRQLHRAGLDPIAMVRQDRLLNEELGIDGEHLRLLADFRTAESLRVAYLQGKPAGRDAADRWLTCFRDGMDTWGTGYRSMAFAQGDDQDDVRHFQRFSGEPFPSRETAPGWPRMEPLEAVVQVSVKSARNGNIQKAEVDSTLSLTAQGGALRHIALHLPADHTLPGSFEILELTLDDGTALPWVALTAEGTWKGVAAVATTATSAEGAVTAEGASTSDTPSGTTGETSSTTSGAEPSSSTTVAAMADESDTTDASAMPTDTSDGLAPVTDRELNSFTEQRLEIIALLPKAIPAGRMVRVRLKWRANWQFANWSWEGRPLGPTTGPQPILPVILGAPPSVGWTFTATVGVPGITFRPVSVAVSGDTVRKWEDQGTNWKWVESVGADAHSVALALGRWVEYEEPSASGMPAVRVHMFSAQGWAVQQFPAEARRIVSFLQRFLPDYPRKEVEVYQGAAAFMNQALKDGFRDTNDGLAGIRMIKKVDEDVGESSRLVKEDKFLTQNLLARQIAWQIWGEQVGPASARDTWLPVALSDAFAAFYIRTTQGREAWDDRITGMRTMLTDTSEREDRYGQRESVNRPLSLTGTPSISDLSEKLQADYGFYFMAQMLRRRVGDVAFFRVIDRLAWDRAGQGVSTAQLQEALERASGQDLHDFFDWWVGGGYLPTVKVQVREEANGDETIVHGCVTSNIPFGTFELPIAVTDQLPPGVEKKRGKKAKDEPVVGRTVEALVPVVDGKGAFTVPGREGRIQVDADNEGLLLLWSAKVQTVEQTECEG